MSRFDEIELPDWAYVTAATVADLDRLPVSITDCVESAIALALARKLDSGGELSVAPVSKELRDVMVLLRSRAESLGGVVSAVDSLADRFAARRARVASGNSGA